MNKKTGALLGAAALLLLLFVNSGGFLSKQPDDRMARLQELSLPPDGLALYQVLLREIPEVVSQVPCGCCKKTLEWCYEGGCPPL
jgi:hypothetical protein